MKRELQLEREALDTFEEGDVVALDELRVCEEGLTNGLAGDSGKKGDTYVGYKAMSLKPILEF